MEIKNLSQLKKAISEGRSFTIKEHYMHPSFSGQKRKPNVIQTNGFYSILADDPESPVSKANGGKGYWLGYGKSSDWEFSGGICKNFVSRKTSNGEPVKIPVFDIVFD